MKTEELRSVGLDDPAGHPADRRSVHADRTTARVDVHPTLIMVAFLAGSAVLLALVSAWVFTRFSPQGLTIGLRAPRTTTELPKPAPSTQHRSAVSPSAVPVQATPPPTGDSPWVAQPGASGPTSASPSPVHTTIAAKSAAAGRKPAPSRAVAPPPRSPTSTVASTSSPPAAPNAVTASAGTLSATVTWNPPADGGSPIVAYTITPYLGTTAQSAVVVNRAPLATSVTITGLASDTYTFTVTATNAAGTSPASAPSNAVVPTPAPTAPGVPTAVTVTPGSQSATVSWTAPADGGSAITSYTITPYRAGVAQTPVPVSGTPPATTVTVPGLAVDTYTFTVTATNAIGTSAASAQSASVTVLP